MTVFQTRSGQPAVYNVVAPVFVDAQEGALQLDVSGNIQSNLNTYIFGEDSANQVMGIIYKPLAVSTYTPDLDTSAAAEASSVTKASAGVLYGFTFSNGNAATRYVQVFNATSAPADTTVPVITLAVAGISTFTYVIPMGVFFSIGIVWCNSTTQNSKTIGAADSLAQFYYK